VLLNTYGRGFTFVFGCLQERERCSASTCSTNREARCVAEADTISWLAVAVAVPLRSTTLRTDGPFLSHADPRDLLQGGV
jgi:hypothetical protein